VQRTSLEDIISVSVTLRFSIIENETFCLCDWSPFLGIRTVNSSTFE